MAQGAQVGPEQHSFNDEFGSLTKAFGKMVVARNAAQEQTSTLSASLEQRIELRTGQLDQMNRSLERLNRDTSQITRMSNLPRIAGDMNESGRILSRYLPRLLMPNTGARYLTAASLDRLDCLTRCGDTTHAPRISLDDGWAVRRGSNYAAGTVVLRR